jgi:hypothetical protein
MAKNLDRSEQHELTDLIAVAEARLREFHALRAANEHAGAVYIGRYAIEVFLKCAICKRLGKTKLPKLFHSHDLPGLLYFTGLEDELKNLEPLRHKSFEDVKGQQVDDLRYQNPGKVTVTDCNDWNAWLNDSQAGLVPWLREKLK